MPARVLPRVHSRLAGGRGDGEPLLFSSLAARDGVNTHRSLCPALCRPLQPTTQGCARSAAPSVTSSSPLRRAAFTPSPRLCRILLSPAVLRAQALRGHAPVCFGARRHGRGTTKRRLSSSLSTSSAWCGAFTRGTDNSLVPRPLILLPPSPRRPTQGTIRCRYFDPDPGGPGNASCPFGSSCFYAHIFSNGQRAEARSSTMRLAHDLLFRCQHWDTDCGRDDDVRETALQKGGKKRVCILATCRRCSACANTGRRKAT